jgi:hypothetical protein
LARRFRLCAIKNSRRAVAITAWPNLKISQRSCGFYLAIGPGNSGCISQPLAIFRNYRILLVRPTGDHHWKK